MNDAGESAPAPTPEPKPPPQPAPASSQAPAAVTAPAAAAAPERPRRNRRLRCAAMALGALAALTAVFYVEENWRGRSAWEAVETKLGNLQEKLDWAAYIPPAAPDDQNFYKAPRMQDWFGGKGTNQLTARLSLDTFAALGWHRTNGNGSVMVAELILRSPETGATPPGAAAPPPEVVPVISLDNILLSEAIRRLADQAKLKLNLDAQVIAGRPGADGKPGPPIRVTGQWTNVSALSVLMTVLCKNDLRWEDDAKTGVALIKEAGLTDVSGGSSLVSREFVLAAIGDAIGPVGQAADGFPLSRNALRQDPPRRLSVTPDSVPTQNELARLFPALNALRIEPGGNSLQAWLNVVPVAAADYLAWSDQFSGEFDKIREAVKRPSARLDGDYGQLCRVPAPNLTAVRVVALRLSSRAKAFVLRGQPEEALRELTLLHDLGGLLEGKPAGRGMTLSRAMAEVAITDLYAETINDGLRWHVWREGELAALQDQLSRMDVISLVWNALESERAGDCRLLETGARAEAAREFDIGAGKTNFWQEIRSPSRMALQFMPRGWLCQNMAHLAVWEQKMIDSVDRLQGIIRPRLVQEAGGQIKVEALLHRHSFFWFLAKDIIPPMSARLETTALAQTAVNEALVVCALERCRLARGDYPATLHDLAPDFITLLPPDPVNGGPLQYRLLAPGRFLLYSIGWDEKDDHGAPLDAAGKGDWVWGRL